MSYVIRKIFILIMIGVIIVGLTTLICWFSGIKNIGTLSDILFAVGGITAFIGVSSVFSSNASANNYRERTMSIAENGVNKSVSNSLNEVWKAYSISLYFMIIAAVILLFSLIFGKLK